MLSPDFAGQTVDMSEVYEAHSVGKPYVKKNYKRACYASMEQEGKIR